MRTARVIAVDRDLYTVRPAGGEDIHARLSGRFRNQAEDATKLPCAGDRVAVEISADTGVIHDVLPRDTVLRRKRPGKDVDFQLIAANIDVAFVVQGCHFDFNVRRLDRYTHEPGCAVRGSVDKGELASYHKLIRENERNAQAYHERRQVDRQFGKHCKAIMKLKNRGS